MDAFVEHLKSLCREHPTRAKWVCVPWHGVGRTIGDRLVLEGTDWANLRFVTPLNLALRIGAPYLVERGIDPSEEQLGPALIMRLLLGLPETHTYFRPLAHEPRMAMALWSTIRELRAAGVRAADLHADHFESTDKHAELQALLDAYERHLADNKLGDQATVFEEALKHPKWCPVKTEDCVTMLPGVQWTPLQRRLLDGLPGESLACEPRTADRRPRTEDCRPARFFTAGGPESEVEEVMRRILASGRKLDEVEIACASEGYSTLLWEKACRYEWPVTLATGLPATLTRPGRALLGLIEWVEDNFAAGKLRRLLQSGDVKMSSELISPGRAAKLLVRANAAWGRATYRLDEPDLRPLIDEAVATVAGVAQADFWTAANASPEAHEEAPFAVRETVEGLPQVLTGVIDLVYRTDAAWQIVDYKTDVEGQADEIVAKHAAQMGAYKTAWGRVSHSVANAAVVSARHGRARG